MERGFGRDLSAGEKLEVGVALRRGGSDLVGRVGIDEQRSVAAAVMRIVMVARAPRRLVMVVGIAVTMAFVRRAWVGHSIMVGVFPHDVGAGFLLRREDGAREEEQGTQGADDGFHAGHSTDSRPVTQVACHGGQPWYGPWRRGPSPLAFYRSVSDSTALRTSAPYSLSRGSLPTTSTMTAFLALSVR